MITASLALLAILGQPVPQPSLKWTQVGMTKHQTVSGLARWDTAGLKFVMVLDNKKDTQEQVSWLTKTGNGWKRTPLEISDPKKLAVNDPIKDLEGVCRIPGRADEILAIGDRGAEQGWVFRFKMGANNVTLLDAFQVPGVKGYSDYEGIDIVGKGNGLALVWGDRGGGGNPASVSAAPLNFGKRPASPLGPVVTISIQTPWPTGPAARPLGDVRVAASGTVYVSSVTDPGDEGPFSSAIYAVGKIATGPGKVQLRGIAPKGICRIDKHKVEAIELAATGKGMFFGTDDEDKGGWIASFSG